MKTAVAVLAVFSALTVGPVSAQELPNDISLVPAWAQTPSSDVSLVPAWAQKPPQGIPVVRLDKSVFASGESVFFWTGVQAINHTSIPKEYWGTCRQTITRPDGTQRTDRIGWPIDGAVDLGWIGGSGLGENPQPGRYLIVFEFAGQKTAPTPLIVEDLPILKQIKAEFVFGAQEKGPNGLETPVTLTVHNGTNQTLRFPHRDGVNGRVFFSFSKLDGMYRSDNIYPPEQLLDQDESKVPNHTIDNITWKDTQDIPTITLKPGQTYTQRLSLNTAIDGANEGSTITGDASMPSGRYNVTFSTTLQILIGEARGEFAAVSPVHIPVVSTATCTVSP